jgi:hypothetical protein
MNDVQREERAIWKLEQAGYRVERRAGRYLLTSPERADEIDDLASLAEYADAVYERVWTGHKIIPTA